MQIILFLFTTQDFFELFMNLVNWAKNDIKKLVIAFHPECYNLLWRSPKQGLGS